MMFAKAAIEIAQRKKEVFEKKRQDKNNAVVGAASKLSRAFAYLKEKVR